MAGAERGAGAECLPAPGRLEQSCYPQFKKEKKNKETREVFISITSVCFCRSELLCRNHDNSRRHRSEGGRLQHLPLPQRGLVEAGAVLQARVPGQAGSVAGKHPARHRRANRPPATMTTTMKDQLQCCCTRVRPPAGCNRVTSKTCEDFTQAEILLAEKGLPLPPPPPALLSLYTVCNWYLGIYSAFVITSAW